MKKEELLRAIVDNVGKRKTAGCATSCIVGRAPPDIVIWFPGIARSTRYMGAGRQLSIVPVLFAKRSAIIFAFGNAPIGRIDTGGNETVKCRIRPFRCPSG